MVVFDLYGWVVGILAILNISASIYAWTNRKIPGAFVAGCMALAAAEVCVMFLLLSNASSMEAGYAYARLRFLGLAAFSPLMFILALQYTRQTQWLTRWVIAGLFVIPVLTQIILWFTPGHEQFLGDWTLVRVFDDWLESRTLGGWYLIHALHGGVLVILSLAILIWYSRRVDSSRRRDVNILIFVALVTMYGVSTSFTIGPPPGLRVTPVVLGVASLFIHWLLVTGSLPRVMPVAYDLIFSSISDAVLVLDPAGSVVRANPVAEALLERPLGELVGLPIDTVMNATEGWRTDHTDASPYAITMRAGGTPVPYEVRFLPLTRGPVSIGWLIVLTNMSGRQKAMELQLEKERSRVISNFISDASHEFRTPLSVIKSSAYLLGRLVDAEKSDRHIKRINDHVDRVNLLVNDLQVMASLDSDRPLDREPIDLRQLVLDTTSGFARPLADERKQTLTVTVLPGLPLMQGDRSEIATALQKVLDNAIRYTREGGTITVTAGPDGTGSVIKVRDTGVGMSEETLQVAQQRFYRLDSARSTPGFGLGLSITQKIVERHGGSLTLESAPDAGTTVTLRLP